ncbi:MAG: radical SAM protein [Candidatus Woesearchaeota archaeon]
MITAKEHGEFVAAYSSETARFYWLKGISVEKAKEMKLEELKPFLADPREFNGMLKGPLSACIEITPNCNLQCPVCFADKDRPEPSGETLEKRLKAMSDAGGVRIDLAGGEPTIRKDFADIVHRCIDLGMYPIMSTNGLMSDQNLEIVRQLKPQIRVSIHSLFPEDYGLKCTESGVLNRIFNNVSKLAEYGLNPGIQCVVTKSTAGQVEQIIQKVTELGCKSISLMQFVPHGPALARKAEFFVNDTHFYAMVGKMQQRFEGKIKVTGFGISTRSNYLVSVETDGNVYCNLPAEPYYKSCGNIDNTSFGELFADKDFDHKKHVIHYALRGNNELAGR